MKTYTVVSRPKPRTILPDEDSQGRAKRNQQLRLAAQDINPKACPRPDDYAAMRDSFSAPIAYADYILEKEGRLTKRLIGGDQLVFVDGKYSHPLERIREANRVLKRRQEPQILNDKAWGV